MPSAAYVEFEPRKELRPWVRLLWRYEDDDPSRIVQRVPPDGCPELIAHLAEPYGEALPDGSFERQPRIIFAGQMTRPLCLRAAGPVKCAGLRFEPDGAAAWFGASMEAATDRRLGVEDRFAGVRETTLEGWFSVLQNNVADVLRVAGSPIDEVLRTDVRRQEAGDSLPALPAAEQRRLQRLYLRTVGVSQRMLRSIFRFRKVFDHAAGADASWLAAALDAGYFDQPQMARDFRRFLDCTATEWAREQVELARSVASPRPAAVDDTQPAAR